MSARVSALTSCKRSDLIASMSRASATFRSWLSRPSELSPLATHLKLSVDSVFSSLPSSFPLYFYETSVHYHTRHDILHRIRFYQARRRFQHCLQLELQRALSTFVVGCIFVRTVLSASPQCHSPPLSTPLYSALAAVRFVCSSGLSFFLFCGRRSGSR